MDDAKTTKSPNLLLQNWLSPSFPVGGFAYSHGIEAAIEFGLVADKTTLTGWISDLLACGSARKDAIILCAAHRACRAMDRRALADANDLALALCASRERLLETTQMGAAFASAVASAWSCGAVDLLPAGDVAYPVAVAVAAAGHGLPLKATLDSFLLAFVANLVSAAMRCARIGQTDGQRVIATLVKEIEACAQFAETSSLDDIGSNCLAADIAAMRHETLYSRMFRS